MLTYWAYRAAERAISSVPRNIALRAAAAVGNVAYDLGRGKARLIQQNLAHPLGQAPDDRRVKRAARRAFINYAKYLIDVMRLGEVSAAEASHLAHLSNIELLREAQADGKGVLLCTVHIGGMDLMGVSLTGEGEPIHVVADDSTYGRLYDYLAEERARQDIHLIGWRNLRGLLRALRERGNLVLFCDGGYRRGDVPVELFGEATTFPAGPATLAARTGAPILPVAGHRQPDERFVAYGLPLIRVADTSPAEIQRATQALADALGSAIATDPGQWYMFRPVWPQTDADRAQARAALAAARRGEDWTRQPKRAREAGISRG